MGLIKKILLKSRYMLFFLLVLGIFNGLLTGGLLLFINNTISHKQLPYFPHYDWVVFVGLMLITIGCTKLFQTKMIKLTNDILFSLEIEILKRLKHATFTDFEKLGNENVYTAIEDNRVLGHIPEIFVNAFNSFIIVLCCFIYLFWISFIGGSIILMLIAVLLVFYLFRNKLIEDDLHTQRNLQNTYYKYLNDLLGGFRELKMSTVRNNNLYEKYLLPNRAESMNISIRNSIKYLDNELTGTYSWYLILGVIMFVLPRFFHLSNEKTAAFLIAILYLIGHVAVLITLIPTYTAVKVSNTRLNGFHEKMGAISNTTGGNASKLSFDDLESLRFEKVTFEYKDPAKNETFFLGPIDLTIVKGELIFITGGNGSGKSTFAYLLTGLYRPASGKIFFNEMEISPDDFTQFSNKMSAIFTNNYLFNENYDMMNLTSTNIKLLGLIDAMNLNGIINLNDNDNKLGTKYSKGQQKRLALILALLEDKSLIILDEWAAEQDPAFRRHFYKAILPTLIEQGKTVIAVTHDDDYYECASRLIRFDFGKIVIDKSVPYDRSSTSHLNTRISL